MAAADPVHEALPAAVHAVLDTLWSNGHAGYVVGGGLRDVFLGLVRLVFGFIHVKKIALSVNTP